MMVRVPVWSEIRIRTARVVAAGSLIPLTILTVSGCGVPGKWKSVGQEVLKKQLVRSQTIVRTEDAYKGAFESTTAVVRLKASRQNHCKAVLHQETRDKLQWQSDRCKSGYGLTGLMMGAGLLFSSAGGALLGSGVGENGRTNGDSEIATSHIGGGAFLLLCGVVGITGGIIEAVRQSSARRRCGVKKQGTVKVVRTPTTYECGRPALAGEQLRVAVPLPKTAASDEDDDDDDEGPPPKYHTVLVKTDGTGAATIELAPVLAETWASHVGTHLKVSRKGKTTRVELSTDEAITKMLKQVVAQPAATRLGAGFREKRFAFVPRSHPVVGRVILRCEADLPLALTLKGTVNKVSWKGLKIPPGALDKRNVGAPVTFQCKKGSTVVLQLLFPKAAKPSVHITRGK